FFTEHRWQQLLRAREEGVVRLDHTAEELVIADRGLRIADSPTATGSDTPTQNPQSAIRNPQSHKGTVGAVACDRDSNIAAATSTGGMTNKKFGRVGDTALIGAGTYADNATCAVSCTGHGEFFMVGVTAYDVAARMKYQSLDLETAARATIERLTEIGGDGGFIAVDSHGNVVLPFNSDGMYRASRTEQISSVEIYR
ncbi:MAG TPA: isoaspartyl peptidase/L-asparaginase, partial [Pyrinomonadaceae bacterium]|nr:isoaspartyl peptidase/L-asparaginase [Pyrinomonadaceae bacterium]